MKFTKFGVIILVFIVMLSIFIAKVSNIISVNSDSNSSIKNKKTDISSDNVIIKDTLDNLIWFIQISDIHISIFHDPSRITELQEFCDVTIDAVKPAVVLASGDLTDAKNLDNIGSSQFEEEWIHYKTTLDRCNISKKTVWLDVRGNHDNFNVPGSISKENYYRSYSVQGVKHPRSYLHQIKDKNGNLYSFIAVDACLEPGPRRPFNFMGLLTENELMNIEQLAVKASLSNSTVWFGHYPTSCILSSNSIEGGVRSLIGGGGTAYLCGHLHTLGGFVPKMYTIQKNGYLELELGDWKDNRMYRIAVIDHEMFSFVDVKHREWPVVLVTNPKNAFFTVPSKEPLHRMETSTHIRILAFSVDNVVTVKLRFPGEDWVECQHRGGPLYVLPWNPLLYKNSLHQFEVMVLDSFGREKTSLHMFSLDGTRPNFALMPRLILMSDMNLVFHVLFGLAVIGCVLPLCIVRCLNHAVRVRCIISRPGINHFFVQKIVRKLWILSNIDLFYYSLVMYPLYLSVGPWAVGEIIKDCIGVIFVWGTFVSGGYLPGSFTYAYGFAQLVVFHFPLVLYLSHHLDCRLRGRSHSRSKALSCFFYLWQRLPFFILMSVQLLFMHNFWLEYGSMAVFLGPLRFWSILYAVWLVYCAHVIPEATIRTAASVLYSNYPVTVTVTPCEEDQAMNNDISK